jgi:hypothetical protein
MFHLFHPYHLLFFYFGIGFKRLVTKLNVFGDHETVSDLKHDWQCVRLNQKIFLSSRCHMVALFPRQSASMQLRFPGRFLHSGLTVFRTSNSFLVVRMRQKLLSILRLHHCLSSSPTTRAQFDSPVSESLHAAHGKAVSSTYA